MPGLMIIYDTDYLSRARPVKSDLIRGLTVGYMRIVSITVWLLIIIANL